MLQITSVYKSLQFLALLAILNIQEGHASIDVNRIGNFLNHYCHEISTFLRPACNGINTPPCCTLFALVDVCRTTCNGHSNALATKSLASLVQDPAVCNQVHMAGRQFCQFRNSSECAALQCLMSLICFDSRASCFDPKPKVQASDRNRRHLRSRAFELAEMAACESTDLVEFDENNIRECPPLLKIKKCEDSTMNYRTIDGSCNNLNHPDWGKAFHPPQRYVKSDYGDADGFPRHKSKTGNSLKSPRFISRYVSPQFSDKTGHSAIVMAWGQYIDHDFTGFPVIKKNNSAIKCCVENLDPSLRIENGGPCYPIAIDNEDDFFQSKDCMEFVRSSPADNGNGKLLNPREQINALTSYIDGSAVYGSTKEVNEKLRAPAGKLIVGPNNMLPPSNASNCKILDNTTDYCLLAGDHRVNVFVGLGVFHTIFHRHHNSLVDGLARVNPHWDANTLYEEARKIVSALHQHITYEEYLPAILNDATLDKYRLRVGDFEYDPSVRPDMANVFSTAAFRFGHSQVPRFVRAGPDYFKMEDTLMRPHLVLTRFDQVAEGLAFGPSENVDRFFVEAVTDRMFEKERVNRDGLDLVSLNVQRGRDHGLPPYNEFRRFCQLPPVTSFNSSEFEAENRLSHVYEDPDDIDVFIGGVTERHLPGSFVGPLFACLLGQQFHDIKFGDRFYYETDNPWEGFTFEQLEEIKKQTLASVMCANTQIIYLQRDVMFLPNTQTNPHLLCDDTPQINLSKWARST